MQKKSAYVRFLCLVVLLLLFVAVLAAGEKAEVKVYENSEPEFTIMIPADWKGGPESASREKGDYLFKWTGEWKMPGLMVSRADYFTEGTTADDLAEKATKLLKEKFKGKNFEILYTKEIKFVDGRSGYEAGTRWKHPMNFAIFTTFVWGKKGDTALVCAMSDMKQIDQTLVNYMYTLSIK